MILHSFKSVQENWKICLVILSTQVKFLSNSPSLSSDLNAQTKTKVVVNLHENGPDLIVGI